MSGFKRIEFEEKELAKGANVKSAIKLAESTDKVVAQAIGMAFMNADGIPEIDDIPGMKEVYNGIKSVMDNTNEVLITQAKSIDRLLELVESQTQRIESLEKLIDINKTLHF